MWLLLGLFHAWSLESAWSIAHGNMLTSTEWQLVDCDTVDIVCNGGRMDTGFSFAVMEAMCTEDSYSYSSGCPLQMGIR